jgi:PAS domain S-box-containing protein
MADHKTIEQLVNEKEKMRHKLHELEACRYEFISIQERYNRLIESAPDALVFVNMEGKIVLVNAQLEKMFGYSEEELIGKDLEILIPERFRKKHHNNVSDFFSHPRARPMGTNLEISGLRKDGSEFPADISLSPLQTDEGLLATGAIRDITERKKAESRIERNYHIQKAISAVLKVSLQPIPLEGQMDRVLDLILSIPGLAMTPKGYIYLVEDEPDVLVLKAPSTIPDPASAPCRKVPFGKCLCGQAASSCTTIFTDCIDESHEIGDSNRIPHGHYCVPIVSGEKTLGVINLFVHEGHTRRPEEDEFLTAIASTLASIVERHQAEMEKHRLMEQLAEAEKLSALGRITANVADEIRNPLTSVGGFARRLQKKVAEGTKEKEYAEFIVSEVTRMERILRNVISFTKGASPQKEEFDLREVIDEALKLFEERTGEQSIIIERSLGETPLIEGDKEQVREAVENLLSNAIDAMPDGGTLSVITGKEVVKERTYVTVKVKDTGKGIDKDDLGKIFEPFFTTKVAVKGTGLGLSITRKIVEEHGGFIKTESTVNAGSTFSLYFPYKPAS